MTTTSTASTATTTRRVFFFFLCCTNASAIATRFFGRGFRFSNTAEVPIVPTTSSSYQVIAEETCDKSELLVIDVSSLDNVSATTTTSSEGSIVGAMNQEIAKLKDHKASALRQARKVAPHVVDDPALHIVFFKANRGNAAAAAKQYAAYWKNRVQLFGLDKACLPNLHQALLENKADRQALSYGHIRTLPHNDQVLVMDLSRLPRQYDFDSVARATVHVMMDALLRSERMQNDGVVFVVDVGKMRHFDYQWMKLAQYTGAHAFPARTAGYCMANVSPTAARWARRIFLPFLGAEQKRVFCMASNGDELQQCIGVDSLE